MKHMNSFVLGFGLSIITGSLFLPPAFNQAANGCSPLCWNLVTHVQIVQNGTLQSNVATEDYCKQLCANNGTCTGVYWSTPNSQCWFQMPATYTEQSVTPGANNWSLSNCSGDCLPYCWETVLNNSHVSGGTYQSAAGDENTCKLLCSNNMSCIGIDWNDNSNQHCWFAYDSNKQTYGQDFVRHWDIIRNVSNVCSTTSTSTPTTTTTATTTTTPTTTTSSTTKSTTTTTTTSTTSGSQSATETTSETRTSTTSFTNSTTAVSQTAAIIGGVVGGVGGLILIALLIGIIIFVMRSRRLRQKENYSPGNALHESKKNPRLPIIAPKPPRKTLNPPQTSNDPVTLVQLSDHYESLIGKQDGLKKEFELLPAEKTDICTAAKRSEHAKKNRFKNILPYDDSRVTLTTESEGAASDYINASFIQGYDGREKTYIATQGPLKSSLNDFWSMIWNDGVNRIIMVTHLVEQAKNKCEKYWPNRVGESQEFDELTVTFVECRTFTDFTKRVLHVKHKDSDEIRSITQLHFRLWTDKGVPAEVYPLLAFRRRVRLLDREATGPMLVHCSAGVGRTGTFIALDILLEQAEKIGRVSVFEVVTKLRQQRMVMVQVLDQYKLLYRALLESHKAGCTWVSRGDLEQSATTMENFPDSLKIKTEKEYKLLEDFKSLNTINESASGHQDGNMKKTRTTNTIPDDAVRIYLSKSWNQSDYINAVLMKGHRLPNYYILTQLPLPNTVADFWQMVSEKQCPTIIVLEPSDAISEVCWPTEIQSTLKFGGVSVKLSSKINVGSICASQLKIQQGGSPEQVVHLYHLSSWAKDQELPTRPSDILDLLGLISNREKVMDSNEDLISQEELRPTVVICLDGATKSGMFAAGAYLIDKTKNDSEVDVYLSCRYVISCRPQAIVSIKQFQYLYQLAAEYLQWTPIPNVEFQETSDIYANANQEDKVPIYANS